MGAPGGGYDVTLSAIEEAAAGMARVEHTVLAFADGYVGGAATAADGAGDDPLAGALRALAERTRERATSLGEETTELSHALAETAERYRAGDGTASFGGVTG
ncbi:hypothetical protein GCM10023200_01750 [Actinomycetospora chlora]|uniref:ESX-1 secretion-associated protein n=1 Tax=Actinomycetospora chlora TaxID=663608 RepID=A0ABP9A313_9PSEU